MVKNSKLVKYPFNDDDDIDMRDLIGLVSKYCNKKIIY